MRIVQDRIIERKQGPRLAPWCPIRLDHVIDALTDQLRLVPYVFGWRLPFKAPQT